MKKLLFILLVLVAQFADAQVDILSKKIAVSFEGIPLETALKTIESKTEIQFSYSSKSIDVNRLITYRTSGNSVGNILNEILGEQVQAKSKGKYVILQKAQEKKDFFVMGYVKDAETGEEITNASIYEPITLASALSNRYGYYKIKLPRDRKDLDLHFSKEDYDTEILNVFRRTDTKADMELNKVLRPKQLTLEVAEIQINPVKLDSIPKKMEVPAEMEQPEVVITDQSSSKKPLKIDLSDQLAAIDQTYKNGKEQFIDWFLTSKQGLHLNNIKDSLYKPVQISFLPFIGTNLTLSPIVTNDFSFNIVAGYTGNVRKLEMGSVANIVRYNMTGVQMAGALNVVGRQTKGIQMAGGANINLGSADGLIMSGSTNINYKNGNGLHIAGGFNATFGEFSGVQMAPFNYATRLRGTQIGVFNFAYESTGGTPIGFFSYVHKNGYRRLEIAATELNATELSFKTGAKRFYNVFQSAFNYGKPDKPLFGVGYGLGTSWNYSKRFSSNLEVVATAYLPENFDNIDYLSQQFRASLGFEAKLSQRLAVFVAPTLNVFSTTQEDLDFSKYGLLLSERTADYFGYNSKIYSWVGYKFGIRICNKEV